MQNKIATIGLPMILKALIPFVGAQVLNPKLLDQNLMS